MLVLPLAEVTASTASTVTPSQSGNLFPWQAPFAPTSGSPVPVPLTMDSGLDFFAIADYNLNNDPGHWHGSDPTPGIINYHSSDHIFENFNTTFGSVEDAY
jgi:hypothetical protein